jgi:type I restriction enzyme S subunit
MALRARLVAPPNPPDKTWQWHIVKSASIPASVLFLGDRRMEAETYLSSGYGLRIAIESKGAGWRHLGEMARSWQPSRLKGIRVSPDFGTPFLAATQVYDVRPIPRKWLSLDRTEDASNRFVHSGMILVTCSGSVGRPTLAYAPHANTLISHDLLRVEARNNRDWGWIYAYLHSAQARAMTKGVQYGHIIKHLETSHLDALPVPLVDDATSESFNRRVTQILALRDESYRLTLEAEERFSNAFGAVKVKDWGESGFSVKASKAFFSGRKRLDAAVHNPGVAAIKRHLAKHGRGFTNLGEAGFDIWVPGRYKRIPAVDGVIYRDSADLLEVSPDLVKRFADCRFGDEFSGRVRSGWILIPCSGQVYGIIGTATLATDALDDQVVSNHVVRIAPREDSVPVGYVLTALAHPVFGRPVVKALAFGSSVPELDPDDLADLALVRLEPKEESAIAELAEASATARADADLLERDIAVHAGALVDTFIGGSPLARP